MTHAGARALWDIPRLKGDDVLRAVADSGGVIGISAAPHTTISTKHRTHTIASVMDHFHYCADLVGLVDQETSERLARDTPAFDLLRPRY